MGWKIIDTGPASAVENMTLDAHFLNELAHESLPILHLYSWSGLSATFGHFVDPYTLIKKEVAESIGLQLARRPTGGGMIFHWTDFAFSVLVPASHSSCSLNTMDNYACVNHLVIDVVRAFCGQTTVEPMLLRSSVTCTDEKAEFFCMAKPTKYDVMLDGQKVGGAAQRKTKHGFLHQGSISLALPDFKVLNTLLLPGSQVVDSMRAYSRALVPEGGDIEAARASIKNHFISACSD